MTDFVFEKAPWEQELEGIAVGTSYSAAGFLTLMESEEELAIEDAFLLLEERDIQLDISDLPSGTLSGPASLRLRQEAEAKDLAAMLKGLSDTDPLRIYVSELPTQVDETSLRSLAERYASGEQHLSETLVSRCLPLVAQLSMEYTGHGVLMLDLIGEGSLGLWQSILQFQGGDFLTFTQRHIRRYLAKAVCVQARSSGVGQKLREDLADYIDADQKLLMELGRNPTPEEIAESLHLSPEMGQSLAKMVTAAQDRQKIESAREEPELTPEDEQAVEDTAYFQMRQRIMELLSHLSAEDAKLLTFRFGLEGGKPMTPVETGEALGLTPQEVLCREAEALKQLRNF